MGSSSLESSSQAQLTCLWNIKAAKRKKQLNRDMILAISSFSGKDETACSKTAEDLKIQSDWPAFYIAGNVSPSALIHLKVVAFLAG